jgi:hypothetical protein
MQVLDTVIDSIQSGKKQFVKTFVTNDKMADSLNSFIDNQTDYTKAAVKEYTTVSTAIMQEMVKVLHEQTKFDYTKFGEGIMKAYQNNMFKK